MGVCLQLVIYSFKDNWTSWESIIARVLFFFK